MKKYFSAAVFSFLFIFVATPCHAGKLKGPAPDFTLKATDGKNIRLSDYKGKVVMINFWASWCGPCRQEMPILEDIYLDFKDDGFVLLGVNVDEDTEERDEFLADTNVTFPILDDSENSVAELFKNEAMPSSFFVDREGNLRHLHKGYRTGAEKDYIKVIKQLLAR